MTKTEYLLVTLAEECAESIQRVCKSLRFGITEVQPGQDEDNQRRLEREFAEAVQMSKMLGLAIREKDEEAKRAKVLKFMEYSRQLGILEPEGKVYDPSSDPNMKWVVALAEGFKRAGCARSPIVPEPEAIRACIAPMAEAAGQSLLAAAKAAMQYLSGDRICRTCGAVENEPCDHDCPARALREAIEKTEGRS